MSPHRSLYLLAAVALSTAALGACSKGSPTEPTPLVELESFSAASEIGADDAAGSPSAVAEESKRRGRGRGGNGGSDDDSGGSGRRGRGGRGNGDDNGGGRNDDNGDRPGDQRPGRAGVEFEDGVAAVNGQTIRLANGSRVIVNGQTQWSARGDLFTLAQVARSAAAGAPTRVEGRGTRQADGAILALTIKAEVDN